MIQKIVPATDQKLRGITKRVLKFDKKAEQLIADLKDTLLAQKDPEGVGLAAPQIGKNVKVFAMKPSKRADITIIINPELISSKHDPTIKKSKEILEGCLSLPHYYGPLKRNNRIKIKHDLPVKSSHGYTLKTVEEEFTDFEAHIVLHEIDHLNSTLFIDRLLEAGKPLYKLYKDGSWEEVELK